MVLNLKYYNVKDEYSDENIENDVISYIKNAKSNDYSNILDNDMRWPIYYHLSSIRENILNWYPFDKNGSTLEIGADMGAITNLLAEKTKKVVSVELSMRRASAIQERCKNCENLELIVGNLNDIKFEEKFDYITLIGVLEYAPSFTKGKDPMHDFLNKIKKLLKPNGKILIAIENKMGVKYLCGAEEDHTEIPYSGINNYYGISNVKTLDKKEMEKLLSSLNMKYKFYYPYPDYKFPEIITTDKFNSNSYDSKYVPYYSNYSYLAMDEINLYNQFSKLNLNSFFANSFLIEISNESINNDIELIKFQNIYRKRKYQLGTIVKEKEVIKFPLCSESKAFVNNVYQNHIELNNKNYNFKLENDSISFEKLNYTKLIDIIFRDTNTFNKYLDKIVKYIKKSSKIGYNNINIFNKLNLHISDDEKEKMQFLKRGYLDLTFFNAFVDNNDELLFIDQEWAFDYVPMEYIIYRNLRLASVNHEDVVDLNKLYKKYNINTKIFDKLEQKFQYYVRLKRNNIYEKNYKLIDVRANEINYNNLLVENSKVLNSYNDLRKECDKLNKMYSDLEKERNVILESKIILDSEKSEILKKYVEAEAYKEILDEKLQKSQETLDEIYNSRTWKIISKIKRLSRVLKVWRK